MFNAVIKIAVLLAFVGIVACNNDKETALQLLEQAKSEIMQHNYNQAVALLDSIDKAYSSEVDVRRQAMNIRPQAIEGMTLREIENNDSLMAVYQSEYVALTPLFKTINNKQLVEPYIVAKSAPKTVLEKTGIQARITPEGDFYVISSVVGNALKHTSVSFIADNQTATTSDVAYDGDRNYRAIGSEMITFIDKECDTLGMFACNNVNRPLTIRFNGAKTMTITMTTNDVLTFAQTYKYSQLVKNIKSEMRRREFLEQQLSLARDQIARTMME